MADISSSRDQEEDLQFDISKKFYNFVFFVDELKGDWLTILKKKGKQLICAVSPCHNQDVKADGSIVKPHFHLIVGYIKPENQNLDTAKELLDDVLKRKTPYSEKKVEDTRNIYCSYRYLTHGDSPNKFKYDPADIIHLNGFNIETIAVQEIVSFIKQHQISNYQQLIDQLILADQRDLLEYAYKNPQLYVSYTSAQNTCTERTPGEIPSVPQETAPKSKRFKFVFFK